MESQYTVFAVDDDNTMRVLLGAMLGKYYTVELFDCAESCLARLQEKLPDLFLLDVDLPGMTGYELCRKIKSLPEANNIPAVFISSNDTLTDMLAGYDAGAEDYVRKPFDIVLLHRKIENLRRISADRKALAEQASSSDELATLVLANLDEYAVLIKFLRDLNECSNYEEVIKAVLRSLSSFHLEGAVQIRMRNLEKTISHAGENWPLGVAVINNIRTLGRIFEFQTRCAYNFDHITILVTNIPVKDAELCGRIRDHLAIAAESAEAKLMAIQSFDDNTTLRDEIRSMMQSVGQTSYKYQKHNDDARYNVSIYMNQFRDDLLAAFAHLGMNEQQEEEILNMVTERANGLIDRYDVFDETQGTFGKFGQKLSDILDATVTKNEASKIRISQMASEQHFQSDTTGFHKGAISGLGNS
ncbi:MAG: response regulator [Betaproteobacteria bacterium]